ncbi:hypothetical protein CR513_49878, partial [Mucuna pruriens]
MTFQPPPLQVSPSPTTQANPLRVQQPNADNAQKKRGNPTRTFTLIRMTYIELLTHLIKNSLGTWTRDKKISQTLHATQKEKEKKSDSLD